MLPYGVGAIRVQWPICAQAGCAGEGHQSVEDIMTEKHLPDDLDLNEKGLVNRAKGTAQQAFDEASAGRPRFGEHGFHESAQRAAMRVLLGPNFIHQVKRRLVAWRHGD